MPLAPAGTQLPTTIERNKHFRYCICYLGLWLPGSAPPAPTPECSIPGLQDAQALRGVREPRALECLWPHSHDHIPHPPSLTRLLLLLPEALEPSGFQERI